MEELGDPYGVHGSAIPDAEHMDVAHMKQLGQFYDLLELFRVGGDIEETNYIFMVSCRRILVILAVSYSGFFCSTIGRFCGSWLFQLGDVYIAYGSKGSVRRIYMHHFDMA